MKTPATPASRVPAKDSAAAPMLAGGIRRLLHENEEYDGYLVYPMGEAEPHRAKLFLVFDAPAEAVNRTLKRDLRDALEKFGGSDLFAWASQCAPRDLKAVLGALVEDLNALARRRGYRAAMSAVLYRDGFVAWSVIGDALLARVLLGKDGKVRLDVRSPGQLLPGLVTAATPGPEPGARVEPRSASDPQLDADGQPIYLGIRSARFRTRLWRLQPGDGLLLATDGLPDMLQGDLARLVKFLDDNGAGTATTEPPTLVEALVGQLLPGELLDDVTVVYLQERRGGGTGSRERRRHQRDERRRSVLEREEQARSAGESLAAAHRKLDALERDFAEAINESLARLDQVAATVAVQQRRLDDLARNRARAPEFGTGDRSTTRGRAGEARSPWFESLLGPRGYILGGILLVALLGTLAYLFLTQPGSRRGVTPADTTGRTPRTGTSPAVPGGTSR